MAYEVKVQTPEGGLKLARADVLFPVKKMGGRRSEMKDRAPTVEVQARSTLSSGEFAPSATESHQCALAPGPREYPRAFRVP
jgi:hypothetical protein